jgi:hypothetical protein
VGRIGVGWQLAKRSWSVLANDRSLMWFPVISIIFAGIAFLTLAGIGTALSWSSISAEATTTTVNAAGQTTSEESVPVVLMVFLVVAGYVSTTISIFFNVALVSCVTRSIDGHDTTVSEGIDAARARLGVIIKWGVFSYTVGLILRAIEERVPLGGRIAVWIAGAAWAVATLLVIPVLAFEGLGPIDALKRSGRLFKERFGEVLIGRGAIGLAVLLAALVPSVALFALAAFVAASSIAAAVFLAGLGVVVLIAASIVGSTLTQIFNTALYRYSVDGSTALGFDAADFNGLISKPRGA